MKRRFGTMTVVLILLLGAATRASAATDLYSYQLLLDTDNNPATGCAVPVDDTTVGSTTFPGVERLVTVTVARSGLNGTVTGITVQDCVGGNTFGPAQTVSGGSWPVGKGDGVGGGDVIEGFVPLAAIGNGSLVRVAFAARKSVVPNSDVMLSTTGELNGAPVLFRLPFHVPVPLLPTTGLALSILLLGGVAWWALRRRVRLPVALLLALIVAGSLAVAALALTIVLDGQVGDWGTLAPVATDPTGDSTLHDPAEDLVAGFLTADSTNLYFRMDVVTIADLCAGVTCSASDKCHVAGTCDPATGTCSNPPVICSPLDQCHVAGTCDPVTGACSNPNATNGAPCDDGNACTQTDTCQGGVCTGSNPAPNNTPCNDGNACTTNDQCIGGACVGAPVICQPLGQCYSLGICNPSTGVCSPVPLPAGTSCDDGNACTTTDVCDGSGTCAGTPMTCPPPAAGSCQLQATCDPTTGACTTPIAPAGTACDDGDACTINDQCNSAGQCVGTPVVCPAVDQCHGAGTCIGGVCSNPALADGTACNDGNACTTNDQCTAGVCAGAAVTCPPPVPGSCQAQGICDPTTGACTNPTAADNTPCNDGLACTTNDVCTAGVCAGTPVVCPALDQCHGAGTCNPSTGVCAYASLADGTVCNDNNACTQTDTCQSGTCTGMNPVTCSVSGETCDPATGQCLCGTSPCTAGQTCNQGVCQ